MTTRFQKVREVAAWTWRHTSAFVALVLIVGALVLGYKVASPGPEPEGEIVQSEHEHDDDEPQMYTCSMHPSVRLPDPDAKCPICFMDLIPVAEGAGGEGSELRLTISEAARAMSRIETAKVGRFFPTAEVRLFGKVTYDETSVARLSAYFPGRIERLFVNYVGVPVAKGDHLAELYSPELLAVFEELRQSSRSSDESEGMSELVREATRGTLRAARDKLRLFGLTQDQIESIENRTYDSDHLTVYAPIGGVVTSLAIREGDYVGTGDPIATVANLSHLWIDLEAYESQLPLLRWGQPVSFTVEAHPGQRFEGRISFIEPIVDEQTRTAAVRVAVDNDEFRLKPGMFASAVIRPKVSAAGVAIGDEFAGKWVGPMHPTIVKDGPGACDICGMDLVPAETFGVVSDSASHEAPLVIPRSAVLFTGARSVVYVQVEDAESPTYEVREVILGPRAGEFYVVISGLEEGESVVANGSFRVDSAMQIAAKPSMMAPNGGGAPVHDHEGLTLAPAQPSPDVPESFIQSLDPVYIAYLEAQERLAADDLAGFLDAAMDLNAKLGAITELGLAGESLASWRTASAKLRVDPSITTIEDARARFEAMSDGVIELQRRFGHAAGETWNIAFCPMAFDFKGADWLQRGETINNPYFGEAMLQCGEIRESFPSLGEPEADQPESDVQTHGEGHDNG